MMETLVFLAQVVLISLSGVMAPGPVTATTIALGARNRYTGLLVAVGHGIVELPLVIVITLGLGRIFRSENARVAIGAAGGITLLWMGWQMLKDLRAPTAQAGPLSKDKPILAGIVLSAGSPYFLLWWATTGLKLATDAMALGIWTFGLFALVHWLCDVVWLLLLSWASFKGTTLLGPRRQRIVLAVCAIAMAVFGVKFVYDAFNLLRTL